MLTINTELFNGQQITAEYDGVKYIFSVCKKNSTGGYAPIIIEDTTDHNRYYSYGYIEINHHVFVSKWKYEYNHNRDNWQAGNYVIIENT